MTSALRCAADEARRLIEGLVANLSRVAEVIDAASFHERRDIVRGLTDEIVLDAVEMRGEIAFHAVPRLGALAGNEENPTASAEGLSLCMAGARDATVEKTAVAPVVRKAFAWNDLRD